MTQHFDSINRPISIGSPVIFRGEQFTIKAFPNVTQHGFPVVEFNEPIEHTTEIPTECSIDLVVG